MAQRVSEQLINLIEGGVATRSAIARAAGLHANSLRKLGDDDWNPTADTISKLEKYVASNPGAVMANAEEIINEARNGRMFILVDDEDRENEGDLIIPAQMATPDAINFMARFGRGLICLALTNDRVKTLGLDMMNQNNREQYQTAFTVSIEAREGVTTGISAADRARTIAVATDQSKSSHDIVSPGHVFPLQARRGGVLVRAGHTEAAVDIARLAGLNAAGVICEIMRDDGEMARLDDLIDFAHEHKLKIGTIRDLIAYRLRHDHMVERREAGQFISEWGGEWKAISFFNRATETEQLVLQKGNVEPNETTLVRMHAASIFQDIFGEKSKHSATLQRSMQIINEEGSGLIVFITPSPINYFSSQVEKLTREKTDEKKAQNTQAPDQLRDYGEGAQILTELGVHDMELLTNSSHDLVGLDAYGLRIVKQRPIL